MNIHTSFDGGSIDYASTKANGDVSLYLRYDPGLGFRQGFYICVEGSAEPCQLIIENAGAAIFAKGFEHYEAFISYNHVNWSRTPITFVDGRLTITHRSEAPRALYSYIQPHKPEYYRALLGRCRADRRASIHKLCTTTPRDEVDLISIGSAHPDALHIWTIGRQHPGESQASWWMEDFVSTLLDRNNTASLKLELPFKRLNFGETVGIECGVDGCIHSGRASVRALSSCLASLLNYKRRQPAKQVQPTHTA